MIITNLIRYDFKLPDEVEELKEFEKNDLSEWVKNESTERVTYIYHKIYIKHLEK